MNKIFLNYITACIIVISTYQHRLIHGTQLINLELQMHILFLLHLTLSQKN